MRQGTPPDPQECRWPPVSGPGCRVPGLRSQVSGIQVSGIRNGRQETGDGASHGPGTSHGRMGTHGIPWPVPISAPEASITMQRPIRVAVIGCGMMGTLRAAAVRQTPETHLQVVCDAVANRARTVATRYQCNAHTDWRQVVQRDDVDLVIVSTPNHTHAEIAIAAMQWGKHVLCEKPLARTVDECVQMVACAHQHNVYLMVGMNHRYYPAVQRAHHWFTTGDIGQPLTFHGWIGHMMSPDPHKDWIVRSAQSGGGTLIDNGIHLIDLVRWHLGEIVAVQGAIATHRLPDPTCDEQAVAVLYTATGHWATIRSSWTAWRGYHFGYQVVGTRGMIEVRYPPMWAAMRYRKSGGERIYRKLAPFLRVQINEWLRSYRWTTVQTFIQEIRTMCRAIREGHPPHPDGRDGLQVLRIIEAIYTSAQTRQTVTIDT